MNKLGLLLFQCLLFGSILAIVAAADKNVEGYGTRISHHRRVRGLQESSSQQQEAWYQRVQMRYNVSAGKNKMGKGGKKDKMKKKKSSGKGGGKGSSKTDDCPCFTAQRLEEVAPLDGSLVYNQIESCNTNINGQRSNIRIVVQDTDNNNRPAQISRGRGGTSSPNDTDGVVTCYARDQTGSPAPLIQLGQVPDPTGMVEAQIEACNELLFDHCELLRDNNLIADSFDM